MILGSTGSIGVQALEIIAANPDKFRVIAMSAGRKNPGLLMQQAKKFNVPIVGSMAPTPVVDGIKVIGGDNSSIEIAAIPCDIVLNGITGSIGLGPTLSALSVGNKVALANKEPEPSFLITSLYLIFDFTSIPSLAIVTPENKAVEIYFP